MLCRQPWCVSDSIIRVTMPLFGGCGLSNARKRSSVAVGQVVSSVGYGSCRLVLSRAVLYML